MTQAIPVEQMTAEEAKAEALAYRQRLISATNATVMDITEIQHFASQMGRCNWRLKNLGEPEIGLDLDREMRG